MEHQSTDFVNVQMDVCDMDYEDMGFNRRPRKGNVETGSLLTFVMDVREMECRTSRAGKFLSTTSYKLHKLKKQFLCNDLVSKAFQ